MTKAIGMARHVGREERGDERGVSPQSTRLQGKGRRLTL